jgi:hypothetical protein
MRWSRVSSKGRKSVCLVSLDCVSMPWPLVSFEQESWQILSHPCVTKNQVTLAIYLLQDDYLNGSHFQRNTVIPVYQVQHLLLPTGKEGRKGKKRNFWDQKLQTDSLRQQSILFWRSVTWENLSLSRHYTRQFTLWR